MADIQKCNNSNEYKEGAVELYTGLTSFVSLTYEYATKDWSSLIASLATKFRNFRYYSGGESPYLGTTSDIHYPAANTAAVVTYSADTYGKHTIQGIAYSYSAAPTGGSITVENGSGTVIFSQAITASGPGYIDLEGGLEGSANTAMIVTLASGAGSVVGKLNVIGHEVR